MDLKGRRNKSWRALLDELEFELILLIAYDFTYVGLDVVATLEAQTCDLWNLHIDTFEGRGC